MTNTRKYEIRSAQTGSSYGVHEGSTKEAAEAKARASRYVPEGIHISHVDCCGMGYFPSSATHPFTYCECGRV